MLNFRKLKQDFSSTIVKEGKDLYDKQKVVSAKLLHLDAKMMRISAKVLGSSIIVTRARSRSIGWSARRSIPIAIALITMIVNIWRPFCFI